MQRLLAAVILISIACSAQATLEIRDAWSPEAPPGRTMAGFMEIENTGQTPIVLVQGMSPQFGSIEIHDMVNDDGVMRMRKLDGLTIAPQQTVMLRPGSFHIMLMQPNATLVAGDEIALILIDALEQRYPVTLQVRPR